jgi:hypothetical protein
MSSSWCAVPGGSYKRSCAVVRGRRPGAISAGGRRGGARFDARGQVPAVLALRLQRGELALFALRTGHGVRSAHARTHAESAITPRSAFGSSRVPRSPITRISHTASPPSPGPAPRRKPPPSSCILASCALCAAFYLFPVELPENALKHSHHAKFLLAPNLVRRNATKPARAHSCRRRHFINQNSRAWPISGRSERVERQRPITTPLGAEDVASV